MAPLSVFGPAGAQFATPRLDLDRLVWPRAEPGPAFDVPLAEIMDVLVATGERMTRDPDGILAQACEQMKRTSPLDAGVLERAYAELGSHVNRGCMEAMVSTSWAAPTCSTAGARSSPATGSSARVRAFPPRLVHILAGNAPGVAVLSIVRGALVKGVHLLKLPSNDLFTATAMLRTMAAGRAEPSAGALVLRRVLARRRRDGREPPAAAAVLRQARRLGRRVRASQRQELHRAGLRARRVRSEDLDLVHRP